MKIEDARAYAFNNSVDLVLIAPTANPPVCRAIDSNLGESNFLIDRQIVLVSANGFVPPKLKNAYRKIRTHNTPKFPK